MNIDEVEKVFEPSVYFTRQRAAKNHFPNILLTQAYESTTPPAPERILLIRFQDHLQTSSEMLAPHQGSHHRRINDKESRLTTPSFDLHTSVSPSTVDHSA